MNSLITHNPGIDDRIFNDLVMQDTDMNEAEKEDWYNNFIGGLVLNASVNDFGFSLGDKCYYPLYIGKREGVIENEHIESLDKYNEPLDCFNRPFVLMILGCDNLSYLLRFESKEDAENAVKSIAKYTKTIDSVLDVYKHYYYNS